MVFDTDAHQGNGVGRDKLHFKDGDMFILDVYNCRTYPEDSEAKAGIDIKVELEPGTSDGVYLPRLAAALKQAAASGFSPDLVMYNAGTDPYEKDTLGGLKLSAQGIKDRDQMVWEFAMRELQVPICMVLSGGYAPDSASVIAGSLSALFDRFELVTAGGVDGDDGAGEQQLRSPATPAVATEVVAGAVN